jgi:hypothetical protein
MFITVYLLSSQMKLIIGSWASDCESEEEKRKIQANGAEGIKDVVMESGILGNM